MRMRQLPLRAALSLLAVGLIGSGTGVLTHRALAEQPAPSAAALAEAGKKYQARCLSCHQPPDLSFATDRAWLERIHHTA